ncbi:MAG: cyclase family protein [Deltaproteobacteria bacterium]|nr:MAG: cyclase family protein [Deltaproteobacteria bacterium]
MFFVQPNPNGPSWAVQLNSPIELGIPLRFDGPQPNAFGLPKAEAEPFRAGSFVGALSEGGPVNCYTLKLTPHGNGTHTETALHILHDARDLSSIQLPAWMVCHVVSVALTTPRESSETYPVALSSSDRWVTRAGLEEAFSSRTTEFPNQALVVRTRPNSEKKCQANYSDGTGAFLSVEAMDWIREQGFRHVLVDFPSVDRQEDNGLLQNHRRFWRDNLEGTITELVYLSEEHPDGVYMLNLQVPRFCMDAAPSRPVLYPLHPNNA